jgi:hypothetical protein
MPRVELTLVPAERLQAFELPFTRAARPAGHELHLQRLLDPSQAPFRNMQTCAAALSTLSTMAGTTVKLSAPDTMDRRLET